MPERVPVAVADLLVDERNPRLSQPRNGQRDAIRALAESQGTKLHALARDIVEYGLDPSDLFIVTALGADEGRYVVLDGNRRLTALRALECPDLLSDAVPNSSLNAIKRLANTYRSSPIVDVPCVVFEEREAANHWIESKNTGERGGAGPVRWDPDEADRFRSRTGRRPSKASQVLDCLERANLIDPQARATVPVTTLDRMLGSPEIRSRLGLGFANGQLLDLSQNGEALKAMHYVVNEIRERRVMVRQLDRKWQRDEYAANLPSDIVVPETASAGEGVPLHNTPIRRNQTRRGRRQQQSPPRDQLIPSTCVMQVSDHRIDDIQRELRRLSLRAVPNAVAVLFRVFMEMSVDAYIKRESLPVHERAILRSRLERVTDHLKQTGKLNDDEAAPVRRAASGNSFFGPSITLMHHWLHNQHMSPEPDDLRRQWNDLEPFFLAMWPA